MRLWSLHPRLLDRQALVAGWREGLLAQAVLAGKTRGYKKHPQLDRFKARRDPLAAVGAYLLVLQKEATRRSYNFDRSRILKPRPIRSQLSLKRGQLVFEFQHLLAKSRIRSPEWAKNLKQAKLRAHPLFKLTAGGLEPWERT